MVCGRTEQRRSPVSKRYETNVRLVWDSYLFAAAALKYNAQGVNLTSLSRACFWYRCWTRTPYLSISIYLQLCMYPSIPIYISLSIYIYRYIPIYIYFSRACFGCRCWTPYISIDIYLSVTIHLSVYTHLSLSLVPISVVGAGHHLDLSIFVYL